MKEEREETIDVPTLLIAETGIEETIDAPIEVHPAMAREGTETTEDTLTGTEALIVTAIEETTDSPIEILPVITIDALIDIPTETMTVTAKEEMTDTQTEKPASAIEGAIGTLIEEKTEDTEEKREAIIDMLLIPALQVEEEIETVEETTISVTLSQIETEDSLPLTLTGRMKLQELISPVEMTTEEATIEEKAEVETRERSPVQSLMDMTPLWRTRVGKVQLPSGSRVS